jgi:hypothetical protein
MVDKDESTGVPFRGTSMKMSSATWFCAGALAMLALQPVACSSKFSSCDATRTCSEPSLGDAGSAGDSESDMPENAAGEVGTGQGGAAGFADGGEAGNEPLEGGAGGGDSSAVAVQLPDGATCSVPTDCLSAKCTSFHRDADGDNYGSTTDFVRVCGDEAPSGYVLNGSDCCDLDDLTRPGQTTYFGGQNPCSSFDYDCDGDPKPDPTQDQLVGPRMCDTVNSSCKLTPGFNVLPVCGAKRGWISGCHLLGANGATFCADDTAQPQTLRCR